MAQPSDVHKNGGTPVIAIAPIKKVAIPATSDSRRRASIRFSFGSMSRAGAKSKAPRPSANQPPRFRPTRLVAGVGLGGCRRLARREERAFSLDSPGTRGEAAANGRPARPLPAPARPARGGRTRLLHAQYADQTHHRYGARPTRRMTASSCACRRAHIYRSFAGGGPPEV